MNTEKFIKDTLSKVYELLMKETPILHETEESFMEVIINNFASKDDQSMLEALGLEFPLFDEEKLVLSQDIEMWNNLLKSVPDKALPAFALMEEFISQEAFDEEKRPFFSVNKMSFLRELLAENADCLEFANSHRSVRMSARSPKLKSTANPQDNARKLYLKTLHDFKIDAFTLKEANTEVNKKSKYSNEYKEFVSLEESWPNYVKFLKEFKVLTYTEKMETLLSAKMLNLDALLHAVFEDFQAILPEVYRDSRDFIYTLQAVITEFDMSTVENVQFYFTLGVKDLELMRYDPMTWISKKTNSQKLALNVPAGVVEKLHKLLIAKHATKEDSLLKGSEEERYTWLLIQFLEGVPDKDTQVRSVYHSLPRALKILTLRDGTKDQMTYFNNILIKK